MSTSSTLPAPRVKDTLQRLKQAIARVIRGKDEVIDHTLICLAAGGHLLIEDLPGLGKTTLAYSLARSIDGTFSRIQFTSDLLPSDVIGVSIYDDSLKAFTFNKGPIFANIVLADEINRTTPKTQSSLLEVMDRGKVSVDGQSYATGKPFMVFATQNPVDYEGTFGLPESQLDRFLMRLRMGYADYDHELEILQQAESLRTYDNIQADALVSRSEIEEIQRMVPQVYVEESVLRYLLDLTRATRQTEDFAYGISTRGTLSLKLAAQASALADGRPFVIPEDITKLFTVVCCHRLALKQPAADSLEERHIIESILTQLLNDTPTPA